MKPLKPRVLSALVPVALALGLAPAPALSQADNFPTKPVTVVVPSEGTGISNDVLVFINSIERRNPGTSYVIDRKSGAGSTIGTTYVARARPDGYTLLAPNTAFTIAPAFYPNLTYDVTKDFAPITLMMQLIFFSMKAGHTSGKPTRRPTLIFSATTDDGSRERTTPTSPQ